MSEKRVINDSTVARIAGNLLSGRTDLITDGWCESDRQWHKIPRAERVEEAVAIARAIVAEVERTSEAKEADRA